MKTLKCLCFAVWAFVAPHLAAAQTGAELFDRNADGFLSGTEIDAALATLSDPATENVPLYDAVDLAREAAKQKDPNDIRIKLAELKVIDPARRDKCEFENAVFLRKTVTDLPIGKCFAARPKSDGASFSLVEDREADVTKISIEGGVGVVLPPFRFDYRDISKDAFVLTEIIPMVFVESDADFRSDGGNTGYIRLGSKAEAVFEGGIGALFLGLSGYYQSDLKLGVSAWGAQVNVTPQHVGLGINGFTRGLEDDRDFMIVAVGTADYLHVNDPAGSNLGMDRDYFWVGGTLGFEYTDRSFYKNGLTLKSGITALWDLNSGDDAIEFNTDFDVMLDNEGITAIGLNYTRGRDRKTLTFDDVISVNLKLKL